MLLHNEFRTGCGMELQSCIRLRGVCHKARLQRWNLQLNHCIDAEVRETLKLSKEVLWLLFAVLFARDPQDP